MKLENAITVRSVADAHGAKFAGDGRRLITGLNEIHMVVKGDITFVDHPKYYDRVLRSAASTIIINKEVECPEGKSLIFSEDPFTVYTSLVKKYRGFEPAAKRVNDSAIIGEGTVIQPGTFIGNHVKIGKNCVIHPNVTIYDHSQIGNNVIIHAGSVIGADAYYFKRRNWGYDKMLSCGRVVIEDDVFMVTIAPLMGSSVCALVTVPWIMPVISSSGFLQVVKIIIIEKTNSKNL